MITNWKLAKEYETLIRTFEYNPKYLRILYFWEESLAFENLVNLSLFLHLRWCMFDPAVINCKRFRCSNCSQLIKEGFGGVYLTVAINRSSSCLNWTSNPSSWRLSFMYVGFDQTNCNLVNKLKHVTCCNNNKFSTQIKRSHKIYIVIL